MAPPSADPPGEHRVRQLFDAAPFVRALGVTLLGAGDGWCEARLPLRPDLLQQDGFAHAGVQATLADHCCGAAAATRMPEDRGVLSVEFKLNLLRPARGTALRCRAEVLRSGRRLATVDARVWCEGGGEEVLVASMSATMAFVRRPDAAGASPAASGGGPQAEGSADP